MAVPTRLRAAALLAITIVAVASYVAYDTLVPRTRQWPPETLIGQTGYGPLLFLLIPITFGWVALGATRRWVKVLGLVVASVILLIFAIEIIWIRTLEGTWHPPGGGVY
jgi:hypothetical protein